MPDPILNDGKKSTEFWLIIAAMACVAFSGPLGLSQDALQIIATLAGVGALGRHAAKAARGFGVKS